MGKGSNLRTLGDFNQAVVLDAIRRSPHGRSRVELGELTGLTQQTMSNIARKLLQAELVLETGKVAQARGKPRTLLEVNPDGHYAIGVHVDPANLNFVLVDLAGHVRADRRLPTPSNHTPAGIVNLIKVTCDALITEAGIDQGRLLGLGVAAPGPIDIESGVLLDPPQLPSWHNVGLRSELREATGLHVLLDKDATAAATGELWASSERRRDFLFFYLGSGVAAGVVIGGEVIRGVSNNVGEVGEIIVDAEAEDLDYGRRGSLNTSCAPQGLVRQAVRHGLLDPPATETDYADLQQRFTRLCRLADEGNAEATAMLEASARRLGAGIALMINMLDLDLAVIGGPIWSLVRDRFLEVVPEGMKGWLVRPDAGVRVEGSIVGDRVAAHGAAALVLDHFLSAHPSVLLME
ncbi:ROK family protein [Microlunatus parietis]|uniref:Putative NBD/HSP70 family sugar kinase n=1 Tax=Microlunatus parietis TaxID=682979 RepID=A0A7Y9ICG6_9ACTN|nr:ROK family protein [Microlunatus parietis]NYE74063.1 putative NBD/HSP70 family sugar kinase [Microlunatus parietis]